MWSPTSTALEKLLIDNADEYLFRKFQGLNERTCLNQKPDREEGPARQEGPDSWPTGRPRIEGELALGRNLLVAFMTFDGYNFEDAIVINQRLVKDDIVHLDSHRGIRRGNPRDQARPRRVHARHPQRFSERALWPISMRSGVVRVGTRVGPGDILVGKISPPRARSELTPEEKLLHAIFGRAGEDVKNDSLEMPAGEEGVVIGAQRYSRRMHMTDDQKKAAEKGHRKAYEKEQNQKADRNLPADGRTRVNDVTGQVMVDPDTQVRRSAQSDNLEVVLEQIESIRGSEDRLGQVGLDQRHEGIERTGRSTRTPASGRACSRGAERTPDRRTEHMKRGDELPSAACWKWSKSMSRPSAP